MSVIQPVIAALVLFGVGNTIFRKFNMGLARNSRYQQLRRYILGSIPAVLPLAIAREPFAGPPALAALATSLLWMGTYNILYHLTHRKTSPDYDNHMDIAFGIYLFGWLTALHTLVAWLSPVAAGIALGAAEAALILIPLVQVAYYATYKVCIDDTGIMLLQNTYLSEALEYVKSFGLAKAAVALLAATGLAAACVMANTAGGAETPAWWQVALEASLLAFFSAYLWKTRHGLFVRTGIAALYIDVRDYNRSLRQYHEGMAQRLAALTVAPRGGSDGKPHTIVMVIGESACRDYMSAFAEQPFDTTPWQSRMRQDEAHFVFFPNAYSCAMQTVPSLERVLTERSLYNDKSFSESCSIVDVAHKAGYTVRWYSNQSYIGINDTSVTLVANTADTAKWVKKTPSGIQYDTSLIDFLDEVNPQENNFVVLHLKGSHFNYSNRYPKSYAQEHGLRAGDDVTCYRNSLHFTDSVLRQFFEKATQRLNLTAMVYFSDHGGIPEKRRSPRFLGFKMVRIPMWVYLSDRYQALHPAVAKALRSHRDSYFTNDLVYELMCGIFDISSNRYDPSSSLASEEYRFTRDDLLTYDGRIRVKDDDLDSRG